MYAHTFPCQHNTHTQLSSPLKHHPLKIMSADVWVGTGERMSDICLESNERTEFLFYFIAHVGFTIYLLFLLLVLSFLHNYSSYCLFY